jgi:uncharacterized protein (TIGR02646 family)
MKFLRRTNLPNDAKRYLDKRQQSADKKSQLQKLDTTMDWKSSRQTKSMGKVLGTLHAMTGTRQRCMYCLDSHGSDIEHFWPKALYPERMYQWPNLLLCCTHCGRLKGDKFPLAANSPMLVDPTLENPWDSLDFDPVTGNICARFDLQLNAWCAKGEKTVEILQLDKREALAAGYLQTFRRLSKVIQNAIDEGVVDAITLAEQLQSEDDHGLLSWCFSDRTSAVQPFKKLRKQQPAVWTYCVNALAT